jgi:hypothetical protein
MHDGYERRRRERAWHGWEYLPKVEVLMPRAKGMWEGAGFSFGREADRHPARVSVSHVIAVPYWSLAAVSLGPLVIWPIRWACRLRRRGRDVCASCGYDLRATPGRCPECGAGRGGA